MANSIRCYVSELLQAYQEIAKKTYTEMSIDFDITLSNLYLYRTKKGNPTADTIDKIIAGVETHCPEALEKTRRW